MQGGGVAGEPHNTKEIYTQSPYQLAGTGHTLIHATVLAAHPDFPTHPEQTEDNEFADILTALTASDAGIPVDAPSPDGTALEIALRCGRLDLAQILVANGAACDDETRAMIAEADDY